MTDLILQFAKKLGQINVSEQEIISCRLVFDKNPDIMEFLSNPTVRPSEKKSAIEKLFSGNIVSFISELCDKNAVDKILDIFNQYHKMSRVKSDCIEATLTYATKPTSEQIESIKALIHNDFNVSNIDLAMVEDKSIVGGCILKVADKVYDKSVLGAVTELKNKLRGNRKILSNPENVIAILKEEIQNFDNLMTINEVGRVTSVGDGIATVFGIDNVEYGEIIIFEDGSKGMVQNIMENGLCGCVLFSQDDKIAEGSKATRTKRTAGIMVPDNILGRVVNSLGEPIDGKGPLSEGEYRPIEYPAPSVTDRVPIDSPLQTGILAIDSMFPIGRGQRELIIGDRGIGKTSLAVDTIINQKGKNMVCVYVAIGQKASTVAQLVGTLEKNGALDYTVVVSSTASEAAPLQYIAPYSGASIAEHFMYQGKDVLIVYDDLSKHAVAYRAISLLLKRPPGREAYPGDVFYLHSRLLERAAKLSPEQGGGSMTALPIIETLAGDISAYIPTNVISITDGQICLEGDLFYSGVRPAVNVGLSVSRVGGAAQTKIMKKISGNLRINLAQFRELEIFSQFGADVDTATRDTLINGKKLIEILKQPLNSPLSLHEQVLMLICANERYLVDVEDKKIPEYFKKLFEYCNTHYIDIIKAIDNQKVMTDELKHDIKIMLDRYKDYYAQNINPKS